LELEELIEHCTLSIDGRELGLNWQSRVFD
jgi:hypothetical protein